VEASYEVHIQTPDTTHTSDERRVWRMTPTQRMWLCSINSFFQKNK